MRLIWFVDTGLAIITHTIDVFTARNIGLASHETAIGKLAHANHVGELNPFDRIDVHT
jgi:hypothetical protein